MQREKGGGCAMHAPQRVVPLGMRKPHCTQRSAGWACRPRQSAHRRAGDHSSHTAQGVGSFGMRKACSMAGNIRFERMTADRFDPVFIQPASFEASLALCRHALGWKAWMAI
jgi:hypothetical protein